MASEAHSQFVDWERQRRDHYENLAKESGTGKDDPVYCFGWCLSALTPAGLRYLIALATAVLDRKVQVGIDKVTGRVGL